MIKWIVRNWCLFFHSDRCIYIIMQDGHYSEYGDYIRTSDSYSENTYKCLRNNWYILKRCRN
jgi:hypothetical protein